MYLSLLVPPNINKESISLTAISGKVIQVDWNFDLSLGECNISYEICICLGDKCKISDIENQTKSSIKCFYDLPYSMSLTIRFSSIKYPCNIEF